MSRTWHDASSYTLASGMMVEREHMGGGLNGAPQEINLLGEEEAWRQHGHQEEGGGEAMGEEHVYGANWRGRRWAWGRWQQEHKQHSII